MSRDASGSQQAPLQQSAQVPAKHLCPDGAGVEDSRTVWPAGQAAGLPFSKGPACPLPARSQPAGSGKTSSSRRASTRLRWQRPLWKLPFPAGTTMERGFRSFFFFFTWKFGTATKKIFPRFKYYLFLPSHSKLLFSTSSLENPADFKGVYLVSSIFQEKDFDYMVVWAQEALEMSSISAFTPFLLLRVHIPLFFTCDSLANMTLIMIGKWLSLWIVKLFSLNNIASLWLDCSLLSLLNNFKLKKKLEVNNICVERLFPAY